MPTTRPLLLNRPKAELVPVVHFAEWHRETSAMAGLTD
jgi:hypothetical protein